MKNLFVAGDCPSRFPQEEIQSYKTVGNKNLLELTEEINAIEENLAKVMSSEEKYVQLVCNHLLKAEGKRLRPTLVFLAGQFGNYDFGKLVTLGTAVEILHMATLIHDDIIDEAELRRGLPTVNKAWDRDVAILLGDYLYGKTLVLLGSLGEKVILGFSDIVTKLIEGEMEQKASRYNPEISIEEYQKRIHNKTAFFISQCCKLGAFVCGGAADISGSLANYGDCLGMAFQIQDDLMDFTEDASTLGKPVNGDLEKGILTLPVIYALTESRRKDEIKKIIRSADYSQGDWEFILGEIHKTDAISYGRKLARYYASKARDCITVLPEGPGKNSLEFLTYFVTERKK